MGKTMPWTAAEIPDLRGQTAVVTGASAGLGVQTALRLAEHGARVVLACRNLEKAAAVVESIRRTVPDADLDVVEVDLSALESVRKAAVRLHDDHGHLDLLINNAGAATMERTLTADGFETTFATNHLGPFALTALLHDLLAAAPAGRVVTVSSGTSGLKSNALDFDDLFFEQRKYSGMRAYGQSKLANLMFALELQRRLNWTGIELISVAAHPGAAESDFAQNFGPLLHLLSQPSLRWVFRPVMQTVEMGALPTLRAATDPRVRGGEFYGPTGATKGYPVLNEPGEQAEDPETAARLWAVSEELTGITYSIGDN